MRVRKHRAIPIHRGQRGDRRTLASAWQDGAPGRPRVGAARLNALLLEVSLCAVSELPLDPETTREVAQLSIRKERLRSMIRPLEDCSVPLLESA